MTTRAPNGPAALPASDPDRKGKKGGQPPVACRDSPRSIFEAKRALNVSLTGRAARWCRGTGWRADDRKRRWRVLCPEAARIGVEDKLHIFAFQILSPKASPGRHRPRTSGLLHGGPAGPGGRGVHSATTRRRSRRCAATALSDTLASRTSQSKCWLSVRTRSRSRKAMKCWPR